MKHADIASSLLQASEQKAAPKDVLSNLFPFIFTASERMSGREISEFLETNHNVKISQPTLARALKDPTPYIADFAKDAFDSANFAAFFLGVSEKDLLWDGGFVRFLRDKQSSSIEDTSDFKSEYESQSIVNELQWLLDNWFKVSNDFRQLSRDEIDRLTEERDERNRQLNARSR